MSLRHYPRVRGAQGCRPTSQRGKLQYRKNRTQDFLSGGWGHQAGRCSAGGDTPRTATVGSVWRSAATLNPIYDDARVHHRARA